LSLDCQNWLVNDAVVRKKIREVFMLSTVGIDFSPISSHGNKFISWNIVLPFKIIPSSSSFVLKSSEIIQIKTSNWAVSLMSTDSSVWKIIGYFKRTLLQIPLQ
jgi:hypothetical protein